MVFRTENSFQYLKKKKRKWFCISSKEVEEREEKSNIKNK